jgi:type 1 glutamine amidotransferase
MKSALVVRGGWDGHRPVEATDMFIPYLKEQGFDVRVEDSTAVYADTDYLAGVDLILQCVTMSTIEPEEFRGLRTAIEAGTGFAGWHGGIADSFRNTSDYLHLVGGQFGCHPGNHAWGEVAGEAENFVPHTVNINDAGRAHPITAGIEDFDLVTEQYWVLADSYVDVLATTTQKRRDFDPWHREVVSPAVWTRDWGQGKVFVCTPGHSLDVLADGNVKTIIERGLLWASR